MPLNVGRRYQSLWDEILSRIIDDFVREHVMFYDVDSLSRWENEGGAT